MSHAPLLAWTHAARHIRPPEPDETPLSPEECWVAIREGFTPSAVVVFDGCTSRVRTVWAKNIDPEEAAA